MAENKQIDEHVHEAIVLGKTNQQFSNDLKTQISSTFHDLKEQNKEMFRRIDNMPNQFEKIVSNAVIIAIKDSLDAYHEKEIKPLHQKQANIDLEIGSTKKAVRWCFGAIISLLGLFGISLK